MPDSIPPLPQPRPAEILEGNKALGEATAFASGADLSSREELNKINQLLRSDNVDGHLHKVSICGIYFVALCFAVVLGVYIYHIATPLKWHFLNTDEFAGLQKFLFSGGLGAAVTTVGKRVLKIEDKKS